MPGNTPELNLKTAVDSDDNADYLTISLASSLQTVDALFSSSTGHDHAGAHEGPPIGTTAISDGAITTDKLADGAVTAGKLAGGTIAPPSNLLVNGGVEIWQRGAGPFSANAAYAADRWQIALGGSSTMSVQRDGATVDTGSTYAAQIVYTHVTASALEQKLENYAELHGRTISLSARVRTATPGAAQLRILTTGTGAATELSDFHTGSGTYETLTVTATIGSSVASITVGVLLGVSCTAYLDNVMLVVGAAPGTYVPLQPADDLARCMRYYETLGGTTSGAIIAVAQTTASNALLFPWVFRVVKGGVPTIVLPGTAALDAVRPNGTGGDALNLGAAQNVTPESVRLPGTTATNPWVAGGGSCALIMVAAGLGKITAEWNP
jgi:hypothetical protein